MLIYQLAPGWQLQIRLAFDTKALFDGPLPLGCFYICTQCNFIVAFDRRLYQPEPVFLAGLWAVLAGIIVRSELSANVDYRTLSGQQAAIVSKLKSGCLEVLEA